MNENPAAPENMNPFEIIGAMENVLDKLAEASGRAKCGYVWVLTELIENLKAKIAQSMEPQIEVVPEEEAPEEMKATEET